MNFSVVDILKILPVVGPTVAATTEFIDRFQDLISDKDPKDQAVLREALEDVQADNDAGFARLDKKLAAAEGR